MAAFIPKLRIKLSGENCFTVEPILPSADDSKVSEYVVTVLNSPASFSFIFVFSNITICTTNICEKCPSNLQCGDSNPNPQSLSLLQLPLHQVCLDSSFNTPNVYVGNHPPLSGLVTVQNVKFLK